MPKYKTLDEYINTFNEDALRYYDKILKIIDRVNFDVKQRLFAGQVAFYVEEHLNKTFHSSPVIVMAFFKDHVNIFANANRKYKSQLVTYSFSAKDTLQMKYTDKVDSDTLLNLFQDSLRKDKI